jgi:hypothetical protein
MRAAGGPFTLVPGVGSVDLRHGARLPAEFAPARKVMNFQGDGQAEVIMEGGRSTR